MSREKGYKGEAIAEKYLQANNYKIITKNFYSKRGEIDIIAQKNDTIIFIEVKAYDNSYINPIHKLTRSKLSHIKKTAQYFIHKHNLYGRACQFDYISVKDGKVNEHLENITIPY